MSFEGQDIDNYGEEDGHRKRDTSRKRDGKRDKKEKGYTMFEEEDSEEETFITPEDVKSPSKAKKDKGKPSFKFPVRKEKVREKEEKKDKEAKKEEKEKRKEEKEGKKLKKEKKKFKPPHLDPATTVPIPSTCENPIFGVPLAVSVDRNKSHDGIELPAIFRECVDYIEECGLTCEGIYRISGVKSKVQALKDSYNRHQEIYLYEHEPNIVASLLKQFLRDLPEPVLTSTLMPKFEEASTAKSNRKKVELFSKLIADLPTCNRLLLSWMIVHMSHVIQLAKENKMTLQNVSIVLSPTMKISHRVLNVLFSNVEDLFGDVQLRKYVPPLRPAHSKWSLELPDNPLALEEELAKQESLLNQLHTDLNSGLTDPVIEEQLWEVQRVVTQLKRKIKLSKKGAEAGERHRSQHEPKRYSNSSLPSLSAPEELQLQLRKAPEPDSTPSVPATVTSQTKAKPSEGETVAAPAETAKSVKFADEDNTKMMGNAKIVSSEKENRDQEKPADGPEASVAKQEKAESEVTAKTETKEEIKEENKETAATTEETNDRSDTADRKEVEAEDAETLVDKNKAVELDESPVVLRPPEEEKSKEVESVPEKDESFSSEKDVDVKADEVKITVKPEADGETKTSSVPETVTSPEAVSEKSSDAIVPKVQEKETDKSLQASKDQEKAVPDVKPVPPFMSLTLLEPVKADLPKPKPNVRDGEEEKEHLRKSEELRELEEELLGEKKEKKAKGKHSEEDVDVPEISDADLEQLLEEEYALIMEEEELRAIEDELRQKIATESSEMERLAQEIQELQYLRQDSDLEDLSSDSTSSDESEDEEDLQDLLSHIIKENAHLEMQNADMCQKIHEERMICLSVKLHIRLLQQKQLETSYS